MKTGFVYCDAMIKYDMGVDHPLRPERLRLTKELISAYGLLTQDTLIEPELATEEDILTVHKPDYIAAVRKLSEGKDIPDPWRFGFDYGDNRPFQGMYDASLLYTGASIKAAELVMSGQFERCFNISGGLHHAMPDRASGFCIFNDPAIAIRRLQKSLAGLPTSTSMPTMGMASSAFFMTPAQFSLLVYMKAANIFSQAQAP